MTAPDSPPIQRLLRLRAVVRRQRARVDEAFSVLVALNADLLNDGGLAHGPPNEHGYAASYHAGGLGESFSHSVAKPATSVYPELGAQCHAALAVWRRRAARLGQLRDALRKTVDEFVEDA